MSNLKNNFFAGVLISLIFIAPSKAAELITNGNFETGDFTGWTVTANGAGGCDTDWNVNSVGGAAGTSCQPNISGTFPGAPGEGANSAYNSFDGNGPQQFRLTQTFTVPATVNVATLSWIETYNVNLTFGATVPRSFTVELTDASDTTVHGTIDSQTIGTVNGTVEIDWTAFNQDVTALLSAHTGQVVTLAFTNIIPESFVGPGGFGLDSVSLNVTAAVVPVPTLTEWSIAFLIVVLGLIGFTLNRRKLA